MSHIVKYGALAGIAVAIYATVEFAIGLHGPYLSIGQYVGYLRYVLVSVGIYLAVKQARDVSEGAPLTFWRAVGIGTGVAAIAGVVTSIYEWAYIQFINPGFMQDYTNFMTDQMREQGASTEQISQMTVQFEAFGTPVAQFIFYTGETLIVGFIFSLIAGALLKTKQPTNTTA